MWLIAKISKVKYPNTNIDIFFVDTEENKQLSGKSTLLVFKKEGVSEINKICSRYLGNDYK
jgi:hypothetical protein